VSTTIPRPNRPRLVDPALAARVPGLRTAAVVALAVSTLGAGLVVVQAVALAHVVDRSLLHHASVRSLVPGMVVVAAANVARSMLQGAGELAALGTADRVISTLRNALLRAALRRGPAWLAGERPGELSVTATRGLRSLHTYYARYLPQAATAAVVPLVLLVWIVAQDWLSFAVVSALVVAVPLTMIFFGRESAARSVRQWRRLSSLAGRFLLLLEGLPTLRAFGREDQGRREVAAATEGVRAATMRTLRVAFASSLSMDMIAGLGIGLVAMVLGLRLLWGELDLQTAMAVLLVAPEVFLPLRRAGTEFHASAAGQAAATRVLEVIADPEPSAAPADLGGPPAPAPTRPGVLRLHDVRIEYPHRDRAALDGFSLEVPAGGRVALTGPSGCGKSTVLASLLQFATPAAGSITLGEMEAGTGPVAGWRRSFSWMPQRPHLFNAPLDVNLRLGAPEGTEDELHRVLAAVGLTDLVAQLPAGLRTPLGHDGLTLSWGERQRIALARALLRPAPVLLLDEPTAALDPPTVARLTTAIEPWLAGRTVIVAAHQPVLLESFDATVDLSRLGTLGVGATT
jgi:thiol reductant ABC exporter CydD subunit